MKKIALFISFFLLIIGFSACNHTKTYGELQDEEQALIASYLQKHNITVVTTMPEVGKWKENEYYKSSSGLYFHLVSPKSATDTINLTDNEKIQTRSSIAFRYKLFTIENPSDTVINNWSTIDYPFPTTVAYGDYTSSSVGVQEAFKYMRFNNSEAKIIVPHNISTSTYLESVTPMAYDLKIKIIQ